MRTSLFLSLLVVVISCEGGSPAPVSLIVSSKVCFHPSGLISVITPHGQVKRWDAQGKSSQEVYPESSDVHFTQILPDGQHVLVAQEKQVVLVDSTGYEASQILIRAGLDVVGAKFLAPTDVLLMTRAGAVEEWRNGQKVFDLPLHWTQTNPQVGQGIFSPISHWVLTITPGDSVPKLWDYQTGGLVTVLSGITAHTDQVETGVFSADGKVILTGGADGKILLWTLEGRNVTLPFPVVVGSYQGEVVSLAATSDLSTIASGDEKGTVRLWKPEAFRSGQGIYELEKNFYIHTGRIESIGFSLEGQKVISIGGDQMVRIHPNEKDSATSWPLSPGSLALSSDGSRFLTVDSTGANGSEAPSRVRVWATDSLKNGLILPSQPELSFLSQTTPYQLAKFSPDGQKILGVGTASVGRVDRFVNEVEIWNSTPTFLGVALYDLSSNLDEGALFLPGSRFVATLVLSSTNKNCSQITLWDTSQFDPQTVPGSPPLFKQWYQFPCMTDQAQEFAVFSSDGKWMFPPANSIDPILLWDTSQVQQQLIVPQGKFSNAQKPKGFNFAEFSADRQHVYTLTRQELFQDWDISDPKNPQAVASWSVASDPLSPQAVLHWDASPDGKFFMILTSTSLSIYDIPTQHELFRFLPENQRHVTQAILSSDGTYVLLSTGTSADSRVYLWQIPHPQELFHFPL